MLNWLKEKWKIVAAAVIAILTLGTYLRRQNEIKEVLSKANESHEKETKVNNDAREKLTKELTSLSSKSIEKIDTVKRTHTQKKQKLTSEKEDFEKDSVKSDKLARDIADHLDADLINND